MAAKKKTHRGKPARTRRLGRLESTWNDTRDALRSAEATVGKRVAALVQRSGLEPREVMRQAEAWRARLDREGKKARKRVEARLVQLKQRARRDRHTLTRSVDEAVARGLAALNIPSRREVQQLSRRVEQLSTRIHAKRR
jgi:Poly(hydroxyalcanoate) granule associated protein (phasin)